MLNQLKEFTERINRWVFSGN